jgi:hypothetical protein
MTQVRSSSKALLEIIVAVVLVIAVASILFTVLGWLGSALWWLVKVAVLVAVIYVLARVMLSRHGK